jgi:hypothetical protein
MASMSGGDVEWLIREFKTAPCSLEEAQVSHNTRCCAFYHSQRDRRRPLFNEMGVGPLYRSEPCGHMFDNQQGCPLGDSCTLAHNTAELLYHPDAFRRRLCQQARRCPRLRCCFFAHSREELLTPYFTPEEEQTPTEDLIIHRFKTQWCPLPGAHEWENCVYAHTYRDWRRVPFLGYSSHPCPRWTRSLQNNGPEMTYMERCHLGMACPMAHGAKEQFYHPSFYKTCPCSDGKCKRGPLCAFSHGEQDRHIKTEDSAQRFPKGVILQANEILRQVQPMCVSPPMYHAFEETTTASLTGAGEQGGKGWGRRGGKAQGKGRGTIISPQYAPMPVSCYPPGLEFCGQCEVDASSLQQATPLKPRYVDVSQADVESPPLYEAAGLAPVFAQ